ncbi:ABC transporter substrate-binding protein [Chitiniphilus eburneus]|uniref:ABC transporter substrate-binding protein n=1 Tax=Chitiniphilus eburneus TaxID=2571148 RepID=UPI0035CF1F2D
MTVARCLVSLTFALLLAACGKAENAAVASAPGDATASQPVAATRQVTDAAGQELAVPIHPERVIVLSENDLDIALALGITPVGTTNGRGQSAPPSYLGELTAGIEGIGGFGQPSMDRVVALRPDLILAGGNGDPQVLAQLGRIAPTMVTVKRGEPWQDSMRRVADALGRRAQADAFLEDYQQRVEALRARLGERATTTVSIVRWTPQGPVYMLGDAFAGRVAQDLGMTRPLAQRQPGVGHAAPLSREALGDIDADWLFIGAFVNGKGEQAELARLMKEPEFRELKAARAGQVREVDAALWTSVGGPLAARQVLRDIETAMLDAPGAQ